jgi:hypothetical protein
MRRLTCHREEGGAVIVLVAIAIVALMGMAGLALDVGAVYGTRAELSRGADAVALAVAQECASNPSACSTEGQKALAQYYATANLDHGVATLQLDVSADERWVEVVTESFREATFMRVLGFPGTTVQARAVAIWGHPGSWAGSPFIINQCTFENWPVDPDTNRSAMVSITLSEVPGGDCPNLPPGGFAFLDVDSATTCNVFVGVDDVVDGNTGASAPCSASVLEALLLDKTITLPLFDESAEGEGSKATFRVAGITGFHVVGYRFPGARAGDYSECGLFPGCVRGYFTKVQQTDADNLDGPDFGVIVVKLVE